MIEEVAKGLQWFSAGEEGGVVQPVRSILHLKEHSGYVHMSSHSKNIIILKIKLYIIIIAIITKVKLYNK